MILMKMQQGDDNRQISLNMSTEENEWFSKAERLMSIDNYPSFEQAQKPIFLLHPNCPHFVFKYRAEEEGKKFYDANELKFILKAFLRRRNLLTACNDHYLEDYWEDILEIVNNPAGDNQGVGEPEDENIYIEHESMENEGGMNESEPHFSEDEERREKTPKSPRQPSTKNKSEAEELKKELHEDPTVTAYEIACYLDACSKKFGLLFRWRLID